MAAEHSSEETALSLLKRLKNQLKRLPERAMRREIFGEKLCSISPDVQAHLLNLIVQDSATSTESARLLIAFQDQNEAKHQLSYEQKRALYEAVKSFGYEKVQELLLAATAPHPSESIVFRKTDESPLGMRKFMARKMDPMILDRLLNDLDPSVIRNILNNPRVTERDVLRICSKRPCPSEVLVEVSKHSRWFQRYQVKLALAQNPYTPHIVAVQALPFLLTKDLHRIAFSNNIHPMTTNKAKEIIASRKTS